MLMKLIEAIRRVRLYKQNPSWQFNDYFISAKNIIPNQTSPVDNDPRYIEFVCIRDYENFTIFIPAEVLDIVKNDKTIYNSTYGLFNISELRRRKKKIRSITSIVYNKTSPAFARLKIIEHIEYKHNSILYLTYVINLNQNDELFKDLLNYKNIESKY